MKRSTAAFIAVAVLIPLESSRRAQTRRRQQRAELMAACIELERKPGSSEWTGQELHNAAAQELFAINGRMNNTDTVEHFLETEWLRDNLRPSSMELATTDLMIASWTLTHEGVAEYSIPT